MHDDDELDDELDDDDLDDEVDDDFEDEDDLEDDEVDDFDDEVVGDGGDDFGDDLGDEVVVAVGGPDGAAARRRSRTRALAFGGVAVAALVLGWFVVRPAVSDDSSAAPADTTASSVEEQADTTVEEGAASGEETSATTEPQVDTTVEEGAASGEETSATTEPRSATTVEEPEATVAEEGAASAEQTSTTARRRSTTTVQEPATTAAETSGSVTYDTLPDGSPAPVVAVYDVDRITLTGAVPSEAARERLEALAVANAKPGQADTVDNLLTVNPDVPIGIGVRVVELTSVRFPPRSTEVLPAHARELDRAVAIMEALPNISALVIGHTDQVGDPLRNFAVSEQRADAVVNYMASQGIAPDRLASRAVGEEDLLTLADDEVARALNRRTEFVFYGLLVE